MVAVGADQGDFARVLMGGGQTGYLPRNWIQEYADPEHPGVVCRFAGLNSRGGAIFDFQQTGSH